MGFFANQIIDSAERERAWERYRIIREFVESKRCRHRQVCVHFGETPKWQSCDACDVCGSVAEWMERVPTAVRAAGVKTSSQPVAAGNLTARNQDEEELQDYLREWRRTVAREKNVAAFVVLHDSTLEEICRRMPKSFAELREIQGIGERKAEVYGQLILDALARFRQGERASNPDRKAKPKPADETLRLLNEGRTLEQIAQLRGRQLSTVLNTVANLLETGQIEFQSAWVSPEKQSVIEAACAKVGLEFLKPVKDLLPQEITYEEIRLVVGKLRRRHNLSKADIPA